MNGESWTLMDLARIVRSCVILLVAVGGCATEESLPAESPQAHAAAPVQTVSLPAIAIDSGAEPPSAAPDRPRVDSTGIKECDAYIARIDVCSRQIFARLPGDTSAALGRIETSLDMMRRSWRNAELTPKGRANLAETCVDSLKMYDSSVKGQCTE